MLTRSSSGRSANNPDARDGGTERKNAIASARRADSERSPTHKSIDVDLNYFTDLRVREFGRLDRTREAYLDYTGSALYADSQIRAHQALLTAGLFGNPHSEHTPSRASTALIDEARTRVLRFLDADDEEYAVCFTANTSAAIKLVAESYPFGPDRSCVLSADNHNSVNGMREFAARAGASVRYVPLDAELRLRDVDAVLEREPAGLFAFPAQSNFSGVRHPLSLIDRAHARGFDVLLDAAAFVPSHALSLRDAAADFVVLSFYKLFGYPTGVGALVARRSALERLRRPWFAGGTVHYVSVASPRHQLRAHHEGFEDGTPNFLGIGALEPGFTLLDDVGMPQLGAHVHRLTSNLLDELRALRHANDTPVVTVYGPRGLDDRGGTVAFNVVDRAGAIVPFAIVESRARDAGVSLRGGCFCNPGASEAAFGFDAAKTSRCLDQLGADFTIERFAACLGADTPVGAVRASVGLANNDDDIRRAIDVVASFK